MGLRLLAILILLHASIAPALYARATSAPAPDDIAACCCQIVCSGCGCVIEEPPALPEPAPTPTPPSRAHDELLRSLALPGARVIDCAALPWTNAAPLSRSDAHARPPVAFRGATAQAALCVRTT